MLQINPFLDCTIYSRIVVHIAQNSHRKLYFIIRVLKKQCQLTDSEKNYI
jgi:ribosomal silencing factor RsfS